MSHLSPKIAKIFVLLLSLLNGILFLFNLIYGEAWTTALLYYLIVQLLTGICYMIFVTTVVWSNDHVHAIKDHQTEIGNRLAAAIQSTVKRQTAFNDRLIIELFRIIETLGHHERLTGSLRTSVESLTEGALASDKRIGHLKKDLMQEFTHVAENLKHLEDRMSTLFATVNEMSRNNQTIENQLSVLHNLAVDDFSRLIGTLKHHEDTVRDCFTQTTGILKKQLEFVSDTREMIEEKVRVSELAVISKLSHLASEFNFKTDILCKTISDTAASLTNNLADKISGESKMTEKMLTTYQNNTLNEFLGIVETLKVQEHLINKLLSRLKTSLTKTDGIQSNITEIGHNLGTANVLMTQISETFAKKLPLLDVISDGLTNINALSEKALSDHANLSTSFLQQIQSIPSEAALSKISTEQTKEIQARLRKLSGELTNVYSRIDALFSIHQLIEISSPLPIMKDWTISSDFGHQLLTEILSAKKGNVIDLGSGISTILAAYALKRKGSGKVFSIEHDKYYYEKTRTLVDQHDLNAFIDLHLCPLIEYSIDGGRYMWYDLSKVKLEGNITTIVVDGPPQSTNTHARYPAIPVLKKYIKSDTTILLDDGKREDEMSIATNWRDRYGFELEEIKSHKGTIKLRKRKGGLRR